MEMAVESSLRERQKTRRRAEIRAAGKALFSRQGYSTTSMQAIAQAADANGDAHLKNWSLLYSDQFTPRLSPAYDILTTSVYIEDEQEFALNLATNKNWFSVDLSHFQRWAEKSDVPWRAIKPHLDENMEKARSLWPVALKDLPMVDEHKNKLREHWSALHTDFRIATSR